MKHIKNCLPNIQKHSPKQAQWKLKLIREWPSIIGNLASKVSIHKMYHNAITLGVSDSGWMQELYLLSTVIKEKINKSMDKPRIETIRFRYISQTKKSIQKKDSSISLPYEVKVLSTREKKALEKIEDPELVKALKRLLQKCHQSS